MSDIIPSHINEYIEALHSIYQTEHKPELCELLFNAQVEILANVPHDYLADEEDYHIVQLFVPTSLLAKHSAKILEYKHTIQERLNQIASISGEYVSEVRIIPTTTTVPTLGGSSHNRSVSLEKQKLIWHERCYRVFISHLEKRKKEVYALKQKFSDFGIDCFVAHADITPETEWHQTIEDALFSADACVAVLTEGYKDSEWCDQEIGCAYGRGIPVHPLKIDLAPYGIIGKLQGINCNWENVFANLFPLILKDEKAKDAYISAIEHCITFSDANTLASVFPLIDTFNDSQINRLMTAWTKNSQLPDSHGFSGKYPTYYGHGLAYYLAQWVPHRFSSQSAAREELKRLENEERLRQIEAIGD